MLNKFISLTVLFVFAAAFAAGPVFAGFEWVPPVSKQQPSGNAQDDTLLTPVPGTAPAPAAEKVPLEPVTTQNLVPPQQPAPPAAPQAPLSTPPALLPVPAEEAHILKLPVPPAAPVPVQVATPAPVQQAQQIKTLPAAKQTPETQAAQDRLLKVKTVAAPAPTPAPAPVAQQPQANPAPEILWNAPPESAAPQNAPAVKEAVKEPTPEEIYDDRKTEQKIILPRPVETEPASEPAIVNEAPVNKKLVINPYPQKSGKAQNESSASHEEADTNSYSPVVGFGSEMPLALALQQIAPAGYIFSFGDNVNPGTNISWDGGGKPWNQVVSEAIAPLGLESSVEGKVVHIKSAGNVSAQHSEAAPPAAAPDDTAREVSKELAFADNDLRRNSVTDPGEMPKKQPLSMPVNSPSVVTAPANAKEAAHANAAPIPLQQEEVQQNEDALDAPAGNMVEAVPLLPEDAPAANEPAAKPVKAEAPVVVRGLWEVKKGDSLKETLDSWSKRANVDLVWNATHDYTVDAGLTMNDSFNTAVQAVVAQGVKTDKPVIRLESAAKNGKSGTLVVQDKG